MKDYKTHLRANGSGETLRTLCGLSVRQGKNTLPLVYRSVDYCNCSNCLTKYYHQNPLTERRTK